MVTSVSEEPATSIFKLEEDGAAGLYDASVTIHVTDTQLR
jgi:hypothetical protein